MGYPVPGKHDIALSWQQIEDIIPKTEDEENFWPLDHIRDILAAYFFVGTSKWEIVGANADGILCRVFNGYEFTKDWRIVESRKGEVIAHNILWEKDHPGPLVNQTIFPVRGSVTAGTINERRLRGDHE